MRWKRWRFPQSGAVSAGGAGRWAAAASHRVQHRRKEREEHNLTRHARRRCDRDLLWCRRLHIGLVGRVCGIRGRAAETERLQRWKRAEEP
eukprot:4059088-Prymnesium_polylepis.2